MSRLVDVDAVFATLKDFQRDSARYVYERMYDSVDPACRFLLADEVGLGKTLVAKGVIAQVVDHLERHGDPRVDIVYVCSNAAIARQNLRKLNPTSGDALTLASRFTMLAAESGRLDRNRLNIVAVTPNTSLKFGNRPGHFSERALLFALVRRAWNDDLRGSGPARVFHLGITDTTAKDPARRLATAADGYNRGLKAATVKDFRAEIAALDLRHRAEGRPRVRQELAELTEVFRVRRQSWPKAMRDRRNRFIRELREALATVGIKALQPDLVILDEFQRFKSLLDASDQSWEARLARDLFNHRDRRSGQPTRTLLVSATPYRMFTTAEETAGDDHYEDFVETAGFLLDDPAAAEGLRVDLRRLRLGLLDAAGDGGAAARQACGAVGDRLRRVMVRTERLASTADRNGMLVQSDSAHVTLSTGDVRAFLGTSRIASELGLGDQLEYWKSGPYLLNYMEGYALKQSFDAAVAGDGVGQAVADLVRAGHGLLPWDEVSRYGALDPGNARLRALLQDTLDREAWRLLWLPPALPWYSTGSEFDRPELRTFTKRLVFSSWRVVPKAVSSLLSYEAERRMVAGDPTARRGGYEAEYSRRPGQLLAFRMDSKRPAGMTAFAFVYPSAALADLGNPREIAVERGPSASRPTKAQVLRAAKRRIRAALAPLVKGRPRAGAVDQAWYWAAPVLLDARRDPPAVEAFLGRSRAWEAWLGADAGDEMRRFDAHIDAAWEVVRTGGAGLGRVPDDLADVLAELAVGGPAVTALRSFAGVSGNASERSVLHAAARVGWGFRSLFNTPDVTALVRSRTAADVPYWRSALAYAIDGNLQAVLDEYAHILKQWRGFTAFSDMDRGLADLAQIAYQALTLRTATYRTDVPRAVGSNVEVERHGMRGRFAVRFDRDPGEDGAMNRLEQVSEAFNSPFWPFVLSTTSIGQEGLDFHLYCHAVVHWNLPSNPVDLEQREGRVHRYKGHAVRKNVAGYCADAAFDLDQSDPWTALFDAAAALRPAGESEIVPYWVFNPDGKGAAIERHVPLLPLSREASRYRNLLRSVAAYRIAFGQPRQEELLEHLLPRLDDDTLQRLVADLRIDLAPRPTPPADGIQVA